VQKGKQDQQACYRRDPDLLLFEPHHLCLSRKPDAADMAAFGCIAPSRIYCTSPPPRGKDKLLGQATGGAPGPAGA
jgi:hypothetical protein